MLIPHNVFHVHRAADDNSSRFATGAVFVTRTKDGPEVAATDSRTLVSVSWADDTTEESYPAEGVGSLEHREGYTALIPVAPWKEAGDRAAKIRAAGNRTHLKSVLLDETAPQHAASLGTTDLETVRVIRPRQVEGRFPDVRKVLPDVSKGYARVTLDPVRFAELLATIAKIQDEHWPRVEVWFPLPAKTSPPLRIDATNDRGHKITGLICQIADREGTK